MAHWFGTAAENGHRAVVADFTQAPCRLLGKTDVAGDVRCFTSDARRPHNQHEGEPVTVEDTARALMAMDDPERRAAVAKGEFAMLGDFDLSREEQRLVVHAARGQSSDEGVEGFGSFAPPYVPLGPVVTLMGAIRYVEDGLGTSRTPLRQDFSNWTAKIGAQGTW